MNLFSVNLIGWFALFHIISLLLLAQLQLKLSDLNLVYACTKDKTLMIDVQARDISDKDLEAGLRLAHPEVTLKLVTYLIHSVIECC